MCIRDSVIGDRQSGRLMALDEQERQSRSRCKPVLRRCPVAGSALGYNLGDWSFAFGGLLGHLNRFLVRGSIDFVLRIGVISCKSEQVSLDLSGIPVSYTHLRAHETPEHLV